MTALERMKKNSVYRKGDIFDGHLDQFNKFLEFTVMPKNSIARN